MEKVGRGWESNGISVGSRGEGLDSSLGCLVFLDQTQKKLTNPPSLPLLNLEGLVEVDSKWRPAQTEPLEPKPLPLLDPMVEATV